MVPSVVSAAGLPPRRTNPWQRHGTTLLAEATTDPDLAIKKAGLDWEVKRVDLRTADTLDPVPDCAAIRRSDTKAILGVVGPDYMPFQNQQMFDVIKDLATAARNGGFPATIETAGSFQGGRVVWALSHIPQLGITIGEDEAKTYLLVSSGHSGQRALLCGFTTRRVICENQLQMAESQIRDNRKRRGLAAGFTIKHLPGIHAAVNEAKDAFAALVDSHAATKAAWKHLASKPLTERLKNDLLLNVFGRPGPDEADRAKALRKTREERIAAILASPTSQVKGTKDTAFSLMQSVVEWVDHCRSTRVTEGRDADESRLFSATFGSGSEVKATAWDAILELTQA